MVVDDDGRRRKEDSGVRIQGSGVTSHVVWETFGRAVVARSGDRPQPWVEARQGLWCVGTHPTASGGLFGGSSGERLPEVEVLVGDGFEFVVLLHVLAGVVGELVTVAIGEVEDFEAGFGHLGGVADGDDPAGGADELGGVADVCGDDGDSAGESFADGVGEGFAGGGADGDVEGGLDMLDVSSFSEQMKAVWNACPFN